MNRWENCHRPSNVIKRDRVQVLDADGKAFETGPIPETVIGVYHFRIMQGPSIGFFDKDGCMICAHPASEVVGERSARIAFDIGGVLSKYPDIFRPMIRALVAGGADVHVITDMHKREDTLFMLKANGFEIPEANVHNSDFERYGEACKAVLLKQLEIDVFLDDFPAYLAAGCPVRLQVLPDLERPYYHDSWVTNGSEGDFGRRSRVQNYQEDR